VDIGNKTGSEYGYFGSVHRHIKFNKRKGDTCLFYNKSYLSAGIKRGGLTIGNRNYLFKITELNTKSKKLIKVLKKGLACIKGCI